MALTFSFCHIGGDWGWLTIWMLTEWLYLHVCHAFTAHISHFISGWLSWWLWAFLCYRTWLCHPNRLWKMLSSMKSRDLCLKIWFVFPPYYICPIYWQLKPNCAVVLSADGVVWCTLVCCWCCVVEFCLLLTLCGVVLSTDDIVWYSLVYWWRCVCWWRCVV